MLKSNFEVRQENTKILDLKFKSTKLSHYTFKDILTVCLWKSKSTVLLTSHIEAKLKKYNTKLQQEYNESDEIEQQIKQLKLKRKEKLDKFK